MKTPQELAALEKPTRRQFVVSTLSAAVDQACLEKKVTKDGGSFEVLGLKSDDWQNITQYLTDNNWNAVLKYDKKPGKYNIKLAPSRSYENP